MDAVLPYRAMAYNNGWANHRLLAACVRLSQADFVARRTGFFPSLRATLNHIMIIDRFYVDAMEGGTLGPAAWADPEPCETAIMLRTAQSEVDRRLIAVVERLGAADLNRVVDIHRGDRTQRERVGRLLLHLFQHQIHHRGQGARDVEFYRGPPAATRRVLRRRRGAAAGNGVCRAGVDRGYGLGQLSYGRFAIADHGFRVGRYGPGGRPAVERSIASSNIAASVPLGSRRRMSVRRPSSSSMVKPWTSDHALTMAAA
jgi:uncharacterized damage-inducible protein DinB